MKGHECAKVFGGSKSENTIGSEELLFSRDESVDRSYFNVRSSSLSRIMGQSFDPGCLQCRESWVIWLEGKQLRSGLRGISK